MHLISKETMISKIIYIFIYIYGIVQTHKHMFEKYHV